jgi:hypothetical protein
VAGDFDQEGLQFALVPVRIDALEFVVGNAQAALHQVVGFGDELHDAVLDAVVDHFHVVARRARAQVRHAGFAVHLGGHGLQDGLYPRVGHRLAARHDAGAEPGALLAARHAHAEEVNVFAGQVFDAAVGVGEVGVAPVDEDVALVELGQELFDDRIDGFARRHQQHDGRGWLRAARKAAASVVPLRPCPLQLPLPGRRPSPGRYPGRSPKSRGRPR